MTVRNGDLIPLEENLNIQVISTSGHSVDGVSCRLGKSLFLGDAIPVKGDIPIYINVRDTLKTLQTIRNLDGICNYYPEWDHTYSVSDIDEKSMMQNVSSTHWMNGYIRFSKLVKKRILL